MRKPFNRFADRYRSYPPLSTEREGELLDRYRRGDKAAGDLLINSNSRFALREAHRASMVHNLELEDCFQVAVLGMLDARERFDTSRGFRFCTYAVHYIRSHLNRYINRSRWIAHFDTTNRVRSMLWHYTRMEDDLLKSRPGITRDEIHEEIARFFGSTREEVANVASRIGSRDQSLNVTASDDLNETFQDRVKAHDLPADDLLIANETRRQIRKAVIEAVASERDETLVRERLLSDDPRTLVEIGNDYGITREAVRQTERKLLERAGL